MDKILKIQSEIGVLVKDQTNPFFKSKYMDINGLLDPQKMGSAITYYRRYALQSLFLLRAEDDDANSSSQPSKPKGNFKIDDDQPF